MLRELVARTLAVLRRARSPNGVRCHAFARHTTLGSLVEGGGDAAAIHAHCLLLLRRMVQYPKVAKKAPAVYQAREDAIATAAASATPSSPGAGGIHPVAAPALSLIHI